VKGSYSKGADSRCGSVRDMRILLALMVMTAVARADSECASPSTCRPACEKGDADACAWMGDYYLSAVELQGDVYMELAATTLENACAKGSGHACARASSAYMRMFHRAQPPDSHFKELREKACKLGEANMCEGKDRLALLEKQCTAGNARSCREAAYAYKPPSKPSPKAKGKPVADDDPPPPEDEDEAGGTGTALALDEGKMGKKDSDRAEGQYKMRKDTEDPQLARQQAIDQARAAGIMPAKTNPDPKKYAALSARADKLVADACAHGRARTCREGGDDPKARERACKVGASESCYELTRHALFDNKPWQSYAQRECDLGDFVGCMFLGNGYETGENGVKADAAKATLYLTKGCDAHDPEACARLAKQTTDKTKSLALYQRSCDEGEPYGCEQVGDADPVRAIAMYQRACDIENWTTALYRPICHELAKKVEAKDPARAKALRKQGCDRGEDKVCKK